MRVDADIAAAIARDLDGSFEVVVRAFSDRMYRLAYTLVGDAREAEELAQDAFVSAYRALRGYSPQRRKSLQLRAWLYTIVRNKVRNRARRAPAAPLESLTGAAEPRVAKREQPDVAVARLDRNAALRKALTELPARYREPIVLHHIEGLEYAEIGRLLGSPAVTVRTNVHRGLAQLRSTMLRENLDVE